MTDLTEPAETVDDRAPRCAECDRCGELRENISSGSPSWDSIPTLATVADLMNFPNLTAETPDQHIGDLDGVLAKYHFEDRVPCSLKGRHPHERGVVLKALCGMTLCMGPNCGKKSIVGFADIWRQVSRVEQFERDQGYLARWPAFFEKFTAPIRIQLDLREAWRTALFKDARPLYDRLSRADGSTTIDVNGQVETLSGLVLFNKHVRAEDLKSELTNFVREYAANPPNDGTSAARLARLAGKANRLAQDAEGWLQETESFANARNIALCLHAAKLNDAKVEMNNAGSLIVQVGNGTRIELKAATHVAPVTDLDR